MADQNREDFTCPNCQARYKIARVKGEAGKTYKPIHCRACNAPLVATDGSDILKYFLVRRVRSNSTVRPASP
jgi:hypothetical protein